MHSLSILRPDDWHLHLRDGALLGTVLAHTASVFARAIVMPNLKEPVTTVAAARAYRERILGALPRGLRFEPLMTLYLTEATPVSEIAEAAASGFVHGVKLYPAGATTNSEAGVRDPLAIPHLMETLEVRDLPLLVHGEVTAAEVDVFDREARFIDCTLAPLLERHAGLRVVLEHVTTAEGVDFVRGARAGVAATITAHHLLLNLNALFGGGLRPHHYCLPVLKRERHREALLAAATGGETRFFLGTDSAPHPRAAKESACGCAGIYTAHAALALYAEAFDSVGALERLEGFASRHGPAFYGLPVNEDSVTLQRQSTVVPAVLGDGDATVVPFRAGETVAWRLVA